MILDYLDAISPGLQHPRNSKYLYARTKTAMQISDFSEMFDVEESLAAIEEVSAFNIPWRDSSDNWENGFFMRITTSVDMNRLVEHLRDQLSELDSWALYGANGDYAEAYGSGPLSLFLQEARRNAIKDAATTQMLLKFRSNERDQDGIVESIKNYFRSDLIRPVFHFRDGRVLFINTKQPSRLIARRCESILRRLGDWVICDSNGDLFSYGRDDAELWQRVDLEYWSDEDDEDS